MWIASFLILLAAAASTSFDESYRAGLQALAQGRLGDARTRLEAAAKIDPSRSRVWLALAQTYWKSHDPEQANTAAERATSLASGDAQVLELLALYYRESGQPLKSCEVLPEAPGVVECYLQAHAPERAIRAATRAGSNWDNRPEVRLLLARAYVETHQWAAAESEFQAAIRLNPHDESYRFEFANSLLQRQKFEQAIPVLEAGKKSFDKSPQLELALGAAYYGLRRFPEAVASFQKTIALAPDLEQPYLFLGKMLDQVPNKLPDLSKLFQSFEKAHPDNYAGYFLHAMALSLQSPDSDVPEELLKKACTLNPGIAGVHFELGSFEERRGRMTLAAAEFERAAALDASDPATHYHLARVYDRLNKPDLAAAERARHRALMK